jgi:hypothetical protein
MGHLACCGGVPQGGDALQAGSAVHENVVLGLGTRLAQQLHIGQAPSRLIRMEPIIHYRVEREREEGAREPLLELSKQNKSNVVHVRKTQTHP